MWLIYAESFFQNLIFAYVIERAIGIVFGLLFGYIATKNSIIAGFWFIGISAAAIAVIFSFDYRKD